MRCFIVYLSFPHVCQQETGYWFLPVHVMLPTTSYFLRVPYLYMFDSVCLTSFPIHLLSSTQRKFAELVNVRTQTYFVK